MEYSNELLNMLQRQSRIKHRVDQSEKYELYWIIRTCSESWIIDASIWLSIHGRLVYQAYNIATYVVTID